MDLDVSKFSINLLSANINVQYKKPNVQYTNNGFIFRRELWQFVLPISSREINHCEYHP